MPRAGLEHRRGNSRAGGSIPSRIPFYADAIIAPMFDPADAPDPDLVYANYLKTCAMSGVEQVPGRFAAMNGAARLFSN